MLCVSVGSTKSGHLRVVQSGFEMEHGVFYQTSVAQVDSTGYCLSTRL